LDRIRRPRNAVNSSATFAQLHALYDRHQAQQTELIDALAERIMTLGAVSIAASHDVAEMTRIKRPPRGRESVPAQLRRLLDAHQEIAILARKAAREASDRGDDGTNDLLVSQVVRVNELQTWFVAEHLQER
jgi:starvation-inducible DNA-binding protein